MAQVKKIKSFKKHLQISYGLIIGIMIIPTVYSIIVSHVHTKQYDDIITNVSKANDINQIAKEELPNELWEIVCGKKDFYNANPYGMISEIFSGIDEMQLNTPNSENREKLEVAYRTCTTLKRNVEKLETQVRGKKSVSENEVALDEIRTITSLFSDIMQDFILSEIELAGITNAAIKRSSLTLSLLQVVIIVFSFAVSLSGYLSVSRGIRKPLAGMQQLSDAISKGDLSARIETPEAEELVPLAENMNKMAEQIDVLISRNVEEQKSIQKAEMKALQAQMTPHFMYNTLDTIIWLAEDEQTEEVVNITKAFSDFLRISLSRGHEWVTVQQEIMHITNYLKIQKVRYADILNYEIKVNPEILEYRMIKLVLQPLVENAIYHGIKNKRGRGHLTVTGDFTDEAKTYMKFTVEDDGAGFTEQRLAEVKKELVMGDADSESLSSVYGLYNVHRKMKLYYGERTEGLKIQSEEGKGCVITFVIPCSGEEENV